MRLLTLFLGASLLGSPQAFAGSPRAGVVAPDFTAENYVTGEKVRLSSQQGKIVILTFWATWCAPCRKELPNLEGVQRFLGKDKITVFAVNFQDNPATLAILKRDAKKGEWVINLLLDPDGRIAKQYGITAIPHMYLIGPDGKIRSTHEGFGDGSVEEMVAELNAVFAESHSDQTEATPTVAQ